MTERTPLPPTDQPETISLRLAFTLPLLTLALIFLSPFVDVATLNSMLPTCPLTQPVCPWYTRRPLLPDGTPASPVFDRTRYLFASATFPPHALKAHNRAATISKRIDRPNGSPRILVIDNALSDKAINDLLFRANYVYSQYRRYGDRNSSHFKTVRIDSHVADKVSIPHLSFKTHACPLMWHIFPTREFSTRFSHRFFAPSLRSKRTA